jgi:hypothetical protein
VTTCDKYGGGVKKIMKFMDGPQMVRNIEIRKIIITKRMNTK